MFDKLLEYTIKIINETLDPDMENKESWFEERTLNHIDLVKRAAQKLAEYNPEFKEFDGTELMAKVESHDQSKFEKPEREPYIELTWRHKTEGWKKSYQTPGTIGDDEINNATLHHIKGNDHHPEYWNKEEANIDPNNRDKSVKLMDASAMPNLAIAEMVADWVAMSEELKTNTARQWFDKTKNVRWKFSPEQEKLIDKLLKVFEVKESKRRRKINVQ